MIFQSQHIYFVGKTYTVPEHYRLILKEAGINADGDTWFYGELVPVMPPPEETK